jgi:iron complex outermembrane receptor protein
MTPTTYPRCAQLSLHFRRAVFLAFVSVALLSHAAPAEKPVKFDVPAADASVSLRQFATQAGEQIMFSDEAAAGVKTRSVKGVLTPREAIDAMLVDTGLIAIQDQKTGAYSVRKETQAEKNGARLALKEGSQPAKNDPRYETNAEGEKVLKLDTFEVFGRKTLNMDIQRSEDDIQPYVVLTDTEIKRSGAINVQEFLRQKLTSTSTVAMQAQGANFGGASSFINLRGLGTDETLILINGRRAPAYAQTNGPSQPDINGIPLSAIERIEILPSTASGIFGGGATGGVVNVILKQDYTGADISFGYGGSLHDGAGTRQFGFSLGYGSAEERLRIMLSGSYSDSDMLLLGEREFAQEARALALRNNPASLLANANPPPLGSTTNIRSVGATLQLKSQYGGTVLPSNFTFVPFGYAGPASDGGLALVSNAGEYNLQLARTAQAMSRSLLAANRVRALSATARYQATSKIDLFVDAGISENLSRASTNLGLSSYVIPATATVNPFVQDVRVSTPAFGLDRLVHTRFLGERVAVGAIADLPMDWTGEVDFSWSSSEYSHRRPSGMTAANGVATGALDVFRDTNVFPIDLSPYATPDTVVTPSEVTEINPSVRLGGTIMMLPAGAATLSGAIEYRRQEMSSFLTIQPTGSSYFPKRWQENSSVYAELHAPIVSEKNHQPMIASLDVQLALRGDAYRTLGAESLFIPTGASIPQPRFSERRNESVNPTVGLRYRPIEDVSIRASFATGFLPPTVAQLVSAASSTTTLTALTNLTDPRRGNQVLIGTYEVLQGGTPGLKPEHSQSWNAGIIVEPRFVEGLRISVDWSRITKTDNINRLFVGQALINSETLVPELILRAAPTLQNDPSNTGIGPIIAFNQRLLNFAEYEVEAYDVGASYKTDLRRAGRLDISVRGTRMMHQREKLTPTALVTENVGNFGGAGAGFLKWNVSAAATVEHGRWTAGWNGQYYSWYWINPAHTVDPNQGSATVGSQVYHDLFVEYAVPPSAGRNTWFNGLTLQITARNVFDQAPPIVTTESNGYSPIADPRLARFLVSLKKSF